MMLYRKNSNWRYSTYSYSFYDALADLIVSMTSAVYGDACNNYKCIVKEVIIQANNDSDFDIHSCLFFFWLNVNNGSQLLITVLVHRTRPSTNIPLHQFLCYCFPSFRVIDSLSFLPAWTTVHPINYCKDHIQNYLQFLRQQAFSSIRKLADEKTGRQRQELNSEVWDDRTAFVARSGGIFEI